MNVTNYFGEYVAKLIGKKAIICKGLIRLSVKDKYPNKIPEQLNYDEIKEIFNTKLKQRLENVGIPEVNKVISDLNKFLVQSQSLLTIG